MLLRPLFGQGEVALDAVDATFEASVDGRRSRMGRAAKYLPRYRKPCNREAAVAAGLFRSVSEARKTI